MRSISPLVQRARLFSLLISLSLLSIVVGASLFSSLRYFSKDTVDVRKVLGMGYEHRFTSIIYDARAFSSNDIEHYLFYIFF